MRPRKLAIVWGAWSVVGLASALSNYVRILTGEIAPAPGWIWVNLTAVPFWALVTPGILWISRRARTWPAAVLGHAAGVALVLALDGLVTYTLFHALLGRTEQTYWQHVWKWSFLDVFFYASTVAVEHAARYYQLYADRRLRASELEAQLARAQLQALQMQIRPHFLFNTLNAISGLVRTGDNVTAIEMLAGLGDLLRALLRSDGAQVVPLRRELDLIEGYLHIEQVRLGDQLRLEILVEPGLDDVLVPNLILQPLVENAIRHGIAASTCAGRLAIRCERTGETLRIAISNSRDPACAADDRGDGIGLSNTRARLAQLYGEAHRFELLQTDVGASAVLEIPDPELAVVTGFRTLIVDDERLARASLRVLLARDPEVELVGECASGNDAVRAILAQSPDLVFLDVEMPRMNGFDVLGAIGAQRRFAVVFVTAHDDYAVEAFEVQARDYLLKPFDDRRFARALDRAKAELRRERLESIAAQLATVMPAPVTGTAPGARIEVRDAGRVVFVDVADIDWIEADDYYVQLHVGEKAYHLRESMRDLEARLDPDRFLRIHRSAIVAIERVAELRPIASGDYTVRLRTGAMLKLSRGRRERLRALLAGMR